MTTYTITIVSTERMEELNGKLTPEARADYQKWANMKMSGFTQIEKGIFKGDWEGTFEGSSLIFLEDEIVNIEKD